MTISAAHLRELIALGIAGDALIRVVEIIDEMSALSADKSADVRGGPLESTAEGRRKERDKQRKRLARAAEKSAQPSANLSADKSEMSADSPLSHCDVLTSLPSKEGLQERKKDSSRVRARGTRLIAGTPLSADNRALIVAEGITDPDRLWVEFVDYWSDIPGQRGVKISWSGTLRNRCRDVIKRGNNGNGTSSHRTSATAGPPQTGADAVLAGMGRIAARVAERQLAERQRGFDLAETDDADAAGAPTGRAAHRSAVKPG